MNGRVAKKIRKIVYGPGGSSRQSHKYGEINIQEKSVRFKDGAEPKKHGWMDNIKQTVDGVFAVFHTRTLVADRKRQIYKQVKRQYKRYPWRMREWALKSSL